MKLTLEKANEMMAAVGGSLDLEGCTGITALPDNLTVGGYLDLEGCTGITALPDNLTVGGYLYLRGTGITALPDNLTVGGSLDLRCTGITALPDNLTVGGSLDLRGTGITDPAAEREKVKTLHEGDYVRGRYIYADGILTHVHTVRRVEGFALYVGKINGKNVVFDGTNYAHCETLRDGIADLQFKAAKDRGADQYKGLTLDSVVKTEEAISMYRIITGACRQGTQNFVDAQREVKESYTIREIIELTAGQYGAERFKSFFEA